MKYLLDTNVILWYTEDNPLLPKSAKDIIMDENSELYISIASLWEISIKYSLKKLTMDIDLASFFTIISEKINCTILPISTEHILFLSSLPFHHRDPFDRIIFSQSAVDKITLIYTDKVFEKYLLS